MALEESVIVTDIALLKKDVVNLVALCGKYDINNDKLQDIVNSLSNLLALQEQRLASQERASHLLEGLVEMHRTEHNADIKEIHSRINTVNRELTEKIDNSEATILAELQSLREEVTSSKAGVVDRIKDIEGWKWMVTGAIALAAWVLSQLDWQTILGLTQHVVTDPGSAIQVPPG